MGQLKTSREAAGKTSAAQMLAAAHKLCLAAAAHRAEVEAQHHAARISAGHERRLYERVHAILDVAATTLAEDPASVESVAPARPAPATRDGDGTVLRVQCLGHFAVFDGDRLLGPWPNRRAKALFKYLVLHRHRPVRKEVLMDVFWPEADAQAARNSLHVAIHGLRRYFREVHAGVSHVLFREGSYMLDPRLPLWVDVEEFERLAASASALDRDGLAAQALLDLQAAAALYRDALFDDDPYEEWTLRRRRELEDTYVAVLERLSDHHLGARNFAACTKVARAILAIDPLCEDTHRKLMRCYARQGRRHVALRQYHDLARALREELNAPPAAATEELHERIRRHEEV